jgi:hypothetical protein
LQRQIFHQQHIDALAFGIADRQIFAVGREAG